MGDLAEVGLDVFHPVQKGTMDEVAIAREYGDRMTFLVGIDVQHTLQERDPGPFSNGMACARKCGS